MHHRCFVAADNMQARVDVVWKHEHAKIPMHRSINIYDDKQKYKLLKRLLTASLQQQLVVEVETEKLEL